MKSPDYHESLTSILEAINDVESFIDDLSYEEFVKDRKTLNAVTLSIEAIGRAAKTIPATIKTENSYFPWQQMANMSDQLLHSYYRIDTKTLYKTAKQDLPPLRAPIEKILKNQPPT